MTNENSFENFGLQQNPVLKASKPRLPLQELNNVIQVEEENTAMMQARKRRVSFANVNTIKEFNAGAESLLVCHTPAYEEPFSACSDSSNPSNHETFTPAKSADCEGNNVVAPDRFSNYNKRVSIGNSRVSLGPDQIGSQDMDFTDVLKTAYVSANTSDMEITAALHGIFTNSNSSHLLLNSSEMTKTKYYNSVPMELTEAITPSMTEGTKAMNNTSFSEMDFTEVLDADLYESARMMNNTTLNGMELTKAISSPLLSEATKQSISNISTTRRRSLRFMPGNGRRSVYDISENGMEFTEMIHNKILEYARTPNNLTENGMELTEAIFPLLQEELRLLDTTAECGMELTEALSSEFYEGTKRMSNIADTEMESTSAVVEAINERTTPASNVTSSRMELTEAVHQQLQGRNKTAYNFSQSGMELTSAVVEAINERTTPASNVTSGRMELTEAVHQQLQGRNKTAYNFSQSGMELTSAVVEAINERTTPASNMMSCRMELTEAVHQQLQGRNKTAYNFSQSGMELTSAVVEAINERTTPASNVMSSRMELTEAVHQQLQGRNKTAYNFSQSGMELTSAIVPIFDERPRSVSHMSSSKMEMTESVNQQFQESNKTVNSFSQSGMDLTSTAAPVLSERTRSVSHMTSSRMELTEAVQQFQESNKTVNNFSQSGMELTSTAAPVLSERTRSVSNMTSSKMELTEAVHQQYQEGNNTVNRFSQSRMELTGPSCNEVETKCTLTQSETELTEPILSECDIMTQPANSYMTQNEMEMSDLMVPKFQEKTNPSNNMTSSCMEFTQASLQRQQKQSKPITSLTQSRTEFTEPVLNGTPCTGTESTESVHSTLNMEYNVDTEMESAGIGVGRNSNVLTSLDTNCVKLTEELQSHEGNKNLNNMVETDISEYNEKSNTRKIEKESLTEGDFQEKLMSVTNDNVSKECEKTSSRVTDFQNIENIYVKNRSGNEEIVADCIDPEAQETENNMIYKIQEKSSNSADVSIRTVTSSDNKTETESMKNNALYINYTDKKETREKQLPCTDLVKSNKIIHNPSNNKGIGEDHSILSCANQSELSNIGSCSKIELTGVTPLDDECEENNLVKRNINIFGDRTLNKEIHASNHNMTYNSELCEKNTGVNNICRQNVEAEVMMNVTEQVGSNKFMESSITSMKESNAHDNDVEMNMDERDCTSSKDEENGDTNNKSTSTNVTKSCHVIQDDIDSVNGNRRSFGNDNLKNEITVTENNSKEKLYESIINSTASKKSGHLMSHDTEIPHSSSQIVYSISPKRNSLLNNADFTVEPAENIEAMDVGGDDQVVNCSGNYVYSDSVNAHSEINSNADSKIEGESHKSVDTPHSASGSVKIHNKTEITTLGSKRKYTSIENMGPYDGSNNPSKIYVQEEVRSNFDNNIVNDMQVTVNTDDNREAGNNEKIVTHCTVEIGSPQSNSKHNVSCLESNREENSRLSNAGVVTRLSNDEGNKHNTDTTQPSVADLSVHENLMRSVDNNDLYQSLANHNNITFRRKSKSLISVKKNRSRVNNQSSSTVDFQNSMVSRNIGVVMSTEITITNVTISDANACSSFVQDKTKSNVECIKTPLTPLPESVKETNNIKEKKVHDNSIKQGSTTADQPCFKTTLVGRNYNYNNVRENTNAEQERVVQQSIQMNSTDISVLQQIPRDFREKWNLHEVSYGVWSLDLIPETLLVIFKISEYTKNDNGIGIVKIMYKEICMSSEDSVKNYMAKSVMRKFSTRDLKKICSESLQIPCMIEHVNPFVQRTIEFGKYLRVLIDIYCAVLHNRMLTFEVCSARSRLWVKICVNLESFEYLSAADITVTNIKGNVEQSVIRKIFDTVKGRENMLYEFVTKVDHYIRIERSVKVVT